MQDLPVSFPSWPGIHTPGMIHRGLASAWHWGRSKHRIMGAGCIFVYHYWSGREERHDGYDTHLEPLSIGKGWLNPRGEEDGSHNQNGIGNDHEDTMCPNKDILDGVHTHHPSTCYRVHSGSADDGGCLRVECKASITACRERSKNQEAIHPYILYCARSRLSVRGK